MQCPSCNYIFTVKGRSNPQNKSYWLLIVTPLAEHLGYTQDECHELLKEQCNSIIEYKKDRNGVFKELRRIKSTTVLSTTEFSEYCSKCRIFASQMNVYCCEPNEPINKEK